MATALATRSAGSPPLKASPPLSAEGMAKAIRLLGTLAPVTGQTRLIGAGDCDRIGAAVDEHIRPCTSEQASGLVAKLIYAYPAISLANRTPEEDYNFRLYTVKLHEAFSVFSRAIGEAIVHGGTGVPSIVTYKPQPSDIVAFGKKELEKRLTVKAMATRHKREAERRAEAEAEERKYQCRVSPEKISELVGSLRAMAEESH